MGSVRFELYQTIFELRQRSLFSPLLYESQHRNARLPGKAAQNCFFTLHANISSLCDFDVAHIDRAGRLHRLPVPTHRVNEFIFHWTGSADWLQLKNWTARGWKKSWRPHAYFSPAATLSNASLDHGQSLVGWVLRWDDIWPLPLRR
jgi:hypothetical protein